MKVFRSVDVVAMTKSALQYRALGTIWDLEKGESIVGLLQVVRGKS